MQKNNSIQNFGRAIASFFGRFHIIIFTLLAIGGLAVVIFMLYNLIFTGDTTKTTETGISFNQKTIKNIEKLHTPETPSKPAVEGRVISPFIETNH